VQEAEKILHEISHEFPLLESVYGNYVQLTGVPPHKDWHGEPPFTNFTERWAGTLDYIFIAGSGEQLKNTKQIFPAKILEIPPREILASQTGLPNDFYSSDHVPILCEFILRAEHGSEKGGPSISTPK